MWFNVKGPIVDRLRIQTGTISKYFNGEGYSLHLAVKERETFGAGIDVLPWHRVRVHNASHSPFVGKNTGM